MEEKVFNDQTKYKANFSKHYHNSGDIKTRKKWNDIYMIDVKYHAKDFIKLDKTE